MEMMQVRGPTMAEINQIKKDMEIMALEVQKFNIFRTEYEKQ